MPGLEFNIKRVRSVRGVKIRALLALSHWPGLAIGIASGIAVSRQFAFPGSAFLFARYFSRIFRADVRELPRYRSSHARSRPHVNSANNSVDNKGRLNGDRSRTNTNSPIFFSIELLPFMNSITTIFE